MSWEGASEFVFAFRVRKVWVKPVAGGGGVEVRKEEDYRKGAFLGNDLDGQEGRGLRIEVEVGMEGDGVGLEFEMERNGLRREEVVDDDGGEVVYCGVPILDENGEHYE